MKLKINAFVDSIFLEETDIAELLYDIWDNLSSCRKVDFILGNKEEILKIIEDDQLETFCEENCVYIGPNTWEHAENCKRK